MEPEKMKLKKIVSFCLSGGNIPEGKHTTLVFKPRGEIRDNLLERLGEKVSFEEMVVLQNDEVMTMVLDLEEPELYRGTSRPHVTLETYGDAKPVRSNNLIQEKTELDDYKTGRFPKEAILSAMYYSRDGKQYSTSREDWE